MPWKSIAAACLTLVFTACTIIGDFSREQCSEDADCSDIGTSLVCSNDICVKATSNDACTATASCNDEGGPEQICADGVCIPLADAAQICPVVVGPWRDENVILLATFTHLDTSDPAKAYPTAVLTTALNQINAVGIPDADGDTRLVAAVMCDHRRATSVEELEAAAAHLINDVGVVAWVGDLPESLFTSIKSQLLASQRAIFLSTLDNSVALRDPINDRNDQVWHLLGDLDELRSPYVAALNAAKDLAGTRFKPPATGDDVRIASLLGDNVRAFALYQSLQANLGTGNNRKTFAVGSDFLSELTEFEPHIVVDFSDDGIADTLGDIENYHELTTTSALPPIYISGQTTRYNGNLPQHAVFATDRLIGVEFFTDAEAFANLQSGVASEVGTTREPSGYNTLYDGVFVVAYAMSAAGGGDLNAAKLSAALRRLDEGDEVRPNELARVNDLLNSADATVRFVGTTGPLTWDDDTGARKDMQTGFYCVARDDADSFFQFGAGVYENPTSAADLCWR